MRPRRSAHWVCGFLLLAGVMRAAAGEEEAARRSAQNAREEAKRVGFKLEYRELLPALTPEEQSRATVITNAGFALRPLHRTPSLKWMEPMARGAARCGWQREERWDEVAGELETVAGPLDAAAEVLHADRPLRFVPLGPSLLLPHLAGLKSLANAFTARMALALRAGHTAQAWTNLLAVTALAIRYDPEPAEISHLVRAGLVQQAFAATWEALQTNVWTEAQLGDLGGQWAGVDLFRGVPDTAMLPAAQLLTYTAAVRSEYLTNRVVTPELPRLGRLGLAEPGQAWDDFRNLVHYAASQKDYARKGSYLDEALLIQFYQRRADELRRAIGQSNWLAMRPFPGVTNKSFPSLTTNTPSPLQSFVNLREMQLAMTLYASGGGAVTLLGKLADTEARRRVLLTALAVERVRRRQGHPPRSPAEVPGAVSDYITGGALRYRVEPGGSVVIYSPGLDAEDNGGEMFRLRPDDSGAKKADLVWPRTATAQEIGQRHPPHPSAPEIDPHTGHLQPAVQSLPGPDDSTANDPP